MNHNSGRGYVFRDPTPERVRRALRAANAKPSRLQPWHLEVLAWCGWILFSVWFAAWAVGLV